jgi:pilus assembly protein FimV
MHQRTRGKVRATKLALALALALSPLASHALGLGNITVHSALNEPLNAEIDLTSVSENELKGLSVSLPTRAEFNAAGVERMPYQSQIQFTIAKRADGQYVIELHTDQPIDEPFLHFLLQVEWNGGKLVREYSALIDPPYMIAGKPAEVEPPVAAEPAPSPTPAPAEQAATVTPPMPAPAEEKAPVEKPVETAKAQTPPPAETAPATAAAPSPEPEQSANASAETAPPAPAPEPAAPAPAAKEAVAPAPQPPAAAPAPEVVSASPDWARASEYHVREGDTLWDISNKLRADKQLTIEQVVLALYRTNRDAFFGNNVNNLKAGKILRVPERAEVASLASTVARKEFRAQYDVWQEYKLKLASASRTMKVAGETPAEETVPAAKGKVGPGPAAAPAQAANQAPESAGKPKAAAGPESAKGGQTEELLQIVRSNLAAQKAAPTKPTAETEAANDTGGTERQALADRVSTLEESLLSTQLEQKEMGEKIGQVRDLLKKESRLIEIERNEAGAPPTAETPLKPIESAKVEPPKAAPPAKPPAMEAPKPAAPVAPAPKPAQRKPVAVPPPAEEKGFLASIMDDLGSVLLPIIVGVFVIAAGIVVIYMRRRRKSIAEFEESILSSEAISSETPSVSEPATTGAAQAAGSGDTSFLSDFSQGGMGNLHTDEVDPIAEAEVYLAYGRDETAEEILKEAIVKNPQREELKVKLLEIYHQRNDVKAFETLAEEYYAQLGGRPSKLWAKVEEMGRKLNPENPMFRGGKPVKAASSAAPAAVAAAPAVAHVAPPAAPAVSPMAVDFDLASPSAPAAGAAPAGLDLDLTQTPGEISFEEPAKAESLPATDAELDSIEFGKSAENVIEFDSGNEHVPGGEASLDWDMEKPAAPTPMGAAEEVALAAAPDAAAEEAAPSHWDETATKLDLAKAYIDMGDSEGARSILNEVMSEGNETQKKQAQELVAQIA